MNLTHLSNKYIYQSIGEWGKEINRINSNAVILNQFILPMFEHTWTPFTAIDTTGIYFYYMWMSEINLGNYRSANRVIEHAHDTLIRIYICYWKWFSSFPRIWFLSQRLRSNLMTRVALNESSTWFYYYYLLNWPRFNSISSLSGNLSDCRCCRCASHTHCRSHI